MYCSSGAEHWLVAIAKSVGRNGLWFFVRLLSQLSGSFFLWHVATIIASPMLNGAWITIPVRGDVCNSGKVGEDLRTVRLEHDEHDEQNSIGFSKETGVWNVSDAVHMQRLTVVLHSKELAFVQCRGAEFL